jgi:uncharacterized protein YndB with AHSA1/START domain
MSENTGRSEIRPRNHTSIERRSDCELVIERTFKGRARIIFEAWTRPELLKRWWAPCSLDVTLFECEADVRVGGAYRYVFGKDARDPMVFSGIYLEVTPYTRLVYTQLFEPMRDAGAATITLTFDEVAGWTRFLAVERYPSKAALDGALASGMEHGMRETLEQLDALIASHKAVRSGGDHLVVSGGER